MTNKKNLIIMGSIVALVVILVIAIIIVLNNKPEVKKTETSPEPENHQTESLEGYNIKCTVDNEIDANYRETHIENLKIDGEKVINSQSSIVLTYATLEEYKLGKEDEYPGKVFYNDDALSIEYTVGDEIDYTKNAEGEEVTLNFSEFRKSLEELGYVCSRNS